MGALQDRALAAEEVGLPVEDVAEERRRLVVQVVAGRDHRVAEVHRHLVEVVALHRAAGGAGLALPLVSHLRDGEAVIGGQVHLVQAEAVLRGEGLALGLGALRVLADAEADVHPVGLVPEPQQRVPEGEAVLAARDGHQHTVVSGKHPVVVDGALDLGAEPVRIAARAEGRAVAADLDVGGRPALDAAHFCQMPPEMTGQTSIWSPDWSRTSRVRITSSRMTM